MRFGTSTALSLCLALGWIAIDASASDAIFRWVDELGVVHFGDRPPQGIEAELVNIRSAPTWAARAPTPDAAPEEPGSGEAEPEPSYAEQRRMAREERRKEYLEERRETETRCAAMRTQRDSVEFRPNVLVQDADGNTRRLDDDEREKLLNEATTYLAENCD